MTCKQFLLTLGRGLALLLAVYVPTFALVSAFVASRAGTAEGVSVGAAIPLVIALSLGISLLLIAVMGRGRFGSFGFRAIGVKSLLLSLGLGLGLAVPLRCLATLLNVQQPGFLEFTTWQLIAFSWLAAPVQEEIIFRGLLQTVLQSGIPTLIPIGSRKLSVAALVSAMAFALVHFALFGMGASFGATAFMVFGALVLGVVAGQMRWSTGSLVPAVLIHALFNIIGSIS